MAVVAVLDPIADSAMAFLRRHVEVLPPPAADWPERADGVVVRASPLGAAAILAAGRLRVIGKHGVGTDNIDLTAAARQQVAVARTPAANADAVAELAIGLMLALLRRIAWHDRGIRAQASSAAPGIGRELKGARLGLLGLGAIGQRVARIARLGFGAQVAAYDPFVQPPPDLEVAMCDSPGALCAESDILSVHLPLTPETRGLVGAPLLSALPEGAFVVNTGRGGVVEERALLAALQSGRLAGAGLDVFEREPPTAELALLEHPNVVTTPHIGASTVEAMDRMGRSVVEQVLDALGVDWRRKEARHV